MTTAARHPFASAKKQLNVEVPTELRDEIVASANRNGRKLYAEVERALRFYLDHVEEGAKP